MTTTEIFDYIDFKIDDLTHVDYLKKICNYLEYYSDKHILNINNIQNHYNEWNEYNWMDNILTYCILFPNELNVRYYLKENENLYELTKTHINNGKINGQFKHPKTNQLIDYNEENIFYNFYKPNHIKTKLESILNSYLKEYNTKTGVIENELDEYIWSGDINEIIDKIYNEIIKK
jgi:hypothetical protein